MEATRPADISCLSRTVAHQEEVFTGDAQNLLIRSDMTCEQRMNWWTDKLPSLRFSIIMHIFVLLWHLRFLSFTWHVQLIWRVNLGLRRRFYRFNNSNQKKTFMTVTMRSYMKLSFSGCCTHLTHLADKAVKQNTLLCTTKLRVLIKSLYDC